MSRSILDIIIKAKFMTINEARAAEGFPPIQDRWKEIMIDIENAYHAPVLDSRMKIVCEYCGHINPPDASYCGEKNQHAVGCGASL